MAIYEREFNPTEGNNPNGKVKFKLKLEWLTHGCVGEIELVEGVNFEFNTNRDSITLSTINGTLTDAPCIGYTFQIIAGNKLSLNPPFNAKEASYGWGGYRQYNQTNTYKSNAPHNLTVLLNSSPADVQITIGGTSMEYGNAGFLPKVAEWHVYGNEQQGRFLTKHPEIEPTYYGVEIAEDIRNNIFSRQLGKKAYELKDHLGNVRVTFSDIKIPTGSGSQPFMVDLLSKSEYYPYGMVIDELSYNLSNNRYGFGGTHELDNEVKGGVGNHLSFGDFGYDTRVARRFNLDPIDQIFISNYAGFGNDPIYFSDPSGYSPSDIGNGSGGGSNNTTKANDKVSEEVVVTAKREPPTIPEGLKQNSPSSGVVSSNVGSEVVNGRAKEANSISTIKPITSGNSPLEAFPSENTSVDLHFIPKGREIFDPTQEIMPGGEPNPDSRQGFRPGDDPMFDAALLAAGMRNPFRSVVTGGVKTTSELSKVIRVGTYSSLKQAGKENFQVRGVYLITKADGSKYIGQSSNIWVRMRNHFVDKKGDFLTHQDATISFIEMKGSTRLEREIYEQFLIKQNGGKVNLINTNNPTGNRMDIYYKEIKNIIKEYNLPSNF